MSTTQPIAETSAIELPQDAEERRVDGVDLHAIEQMQLWGMLSSIPHS